jgi:hypothetical protein
MLFLFGLAVPASGGGSPVPQVTPSATLPGTEEVKALLGGVAQYGLLAALFAVLAGAVMWAWAHRAGAIDRAHRGQMLVLGGVLGALIIGAASVLVNFGYTAGGAFK